MTDTGKYLSAKYAGTCAVCQVAVPMGARAYWDRRDGSLTCMSETCAAASGLGDMLPERCVRWGSSSEALVLKRYETGRVGDAPTSAVRVERVSLWLPCRGRRSYSTYVRCSHEDYPCCGCER